MTEFTTSAIKTFIIDALKKNIEFFFNELDLQLFIAKRLEEEFKGNYKIYLEYKLPKGWNKEFDSKYERWGTERPCFDIVIENISSSKFIAIELKYKHKQIEIEPTKDNPIISTRFGTQSQTEKKVVLVTNQGAENEGRYDFWKDVKRLEILEQTFKNVIGGIALFVTNQENYKSSEDGYKYSKFNLDENPKSGFLHWIFKNEKLCKKKCECGDDVCKGTPCGERLSKNTKTKDWGKYIRPNFSLDRVYKGGWNEINNHIIGNLHCFSVIVGDNQE